MWLTQAVDCFCCRSTRSFHQSLDVGKVGCKRAVLCNTRVCLGQKKETCQLVLSSTMNQGDRSILTSSGERFPYTSASLSCPLVMSCFNRGRSDSPKCLLLSTDNSVGSMSTPMTAMPSFDISSSASFVVGFHEKNGFSMVVVFSRNSILPFTSQLMSPTTNSLPNQHSCEIYDCTDIPSRVNNTSHVPFAPISVQFRHLGFG